MQVKLKRVELDKKEVLINLIEKYDYEFSQYIPWDVDERGLYCNDDEVADCYWQTDGNDAAYFIEVDEKLAGFVMVANASGLGDRETDYMISEFFVMHKYRRSGVGKQAFFDVLSKHKGRWQVFYFPENISASNFWERVIKEYTKGHYELIQSHPHPDYLFNDTFRNVIYFDNI